MAALSNIFGSPKTLSSPRESVLKELNRVISHKDWFIAGSFAVSSSMANDCDVFFLSQEAYDIAIKDFASHNIIDVYKTYAASSFIISGAGNSDRMQLVQTQFGTPLEVLARFDLTCCMKALLPDGTVVVDNRFNHKASLIPENVGLDSINRYDKYTRTRGRYSDHSSLAITFDYMIENMHKKLKNFYTNKEESFFKMLLNSSQSPIISLVLMSRIDAKLSPEQRLDFYDKYIYSHSEFEPNPMLSAEYHGVLAQKTGKLNSIALEYYPELCI